MSEVMSVLIVGEGAREHAIAWKIAASPHNPRIVTAPGNAGTAQLGANFDVSAKDIDGLIELARQEAVDLTIIGPEVPLAAGIVDKFQGEGLRVFGPTRAAAQIEASKSFAKDVMEAGNVPTAKAKVFHDVASAAAFVESATPPFVVKANGLAAGKGVIMSDTAAVAVGALHSMFIDRDFGNAGDTVLIEEWLSGQEVSVFAFVDGPYVSEMTAACDYKRAMDGDSGPNTGGMGSYSPPPFWDEEIDMRVRSEIMEPVATRMAELGRPFRGILYAGLMITDDGPKVIEFNCRMGDPEAQVVLPRLKSDLLELAWRSAEGDLAGMKVEWSEDSWVGVVLASDGYPGHYETGFEVDGLSDDSEDCIVFHAGTMLGKILESDQNTKVLTSGGRVLTVSSRGDTVAEARNSTYNRVAGLQFGNVYYRRDIAADV